MRYGVRPHHIPITGLQTSRWPKFAAARRLTDTATGALLVQCWTKKEMSEQKDADQTNAHRYREMVQAWINLRLPMPYAELESKFSEQLSYYILTA